MSADDKGGEVAAIEWSPDTRASQTEAFPLSFGEVKGSQDLEAWPKRSFDQGRWHPMKRQLESSEWVVDIAHGGPAVKVACRAAH